MHGVRKEKGEPGGRGINMHAFCELKKYMDTEEGTEIVVLAHGSRLSETLGRKGIRHAELRFDDGRHISAEQRKKAYATIRDIADHTGYHPEDQKQWLKIEHMMRTGEDMPSLSGCSMDQARSFINTIMEFAIENGVPLSEEGASRTDDIDRYLYCCLLHRKCAVCGREGEIHHVDTIGMGNDRRRVDDSMFRKICLCRKHHTIAHQRGMGDFTIMYKVYGIVAEDI